VGKISWRLFRLTIKIQVSISKMFTFERTVSIFRVENFSNIFDFLKTVQFHGLK